MLQHQLICSPALPPHSEGYLDYPFLPADYVQAA
jgi:hypothetical protein